MPLISITRDLLVFANESNMCVGLFLVLVSQSQNLSSCIHVDTGFIGITGTYDQNPKIFDVSLQVEMAKDERPYPLISTYSKVSHQLSPK